MPSTRGRASQMTGREFHALREHLKLSIPALSQLLDCKEQTIRNIESNWKSRKPPGRQLALLLRLLEYPETRCHLEEIQHRDGNTA